MVKTDSLEVIRLILPAGKKIKRHEVLGEITVFCLEGKIAFEAGDSECQLTAGKLIHLAGSVGQAAVLLLGNVSSLAAKRAAEHDAENTLGVRRVINYLRADA